jgi:hypothetical protein
MNITYLKYQSFKVTQYHHQKNDPKNYAQAISIIFSSWRTLFNIKNNLSMSWEETSNKLYLSFSNSTKMVIKNVNILHECKKSRDANKLLTTSINYQSNKDENQNSITNLLYSKEFENMVQEDIDEITIQNSIIQ